MFSNKTVIYQQFFTRNPGKNKANRRCSFTLFHHFSTSSSERRQHDRKFGSKFKLDALPFSVSPNDALAEFIRWSNDEQGIKFLRSSTEIVPAYVPLWSFDVNIKFVTRATGSKGVNERYDIKPEPFSIFKSDVVHLPGISSYAGYHFRRSLIDPIHNTSLVFMGDQTLPFASWMLKDMTLSSSNNGSNKSLEVFPDPWNATRGRAFSFIVEELRSTSEAANSATSSCEVKIECLSARRVYMPTFVIYYSVLGVQYTAFLSGCDAAGGISGVSHQVFFSSVSSFQNSASSFLQKEFRTSLSGNPQILARNFVILQEIARYALRLLSRFPIISMLASGFVAFRKLVRPYLEDRGASVELERQREHEAMMDDRWTHVNDFIDSGSARRYYVRNQSQILEYLSDDYVHTQGNYD